MMNYSKLKFSEYMQNISRSKIFGKFVLSLGAPKQTIWKTQVLDINNNLTNVIARLRSCSRCFEIDGASAPYMCDSEVLL